MIANVEGKVLDEQVVCDKGVLTQLNFYCDAVLEEVRLVVAVNGDFTRGLDLLLRLIGSQP